MLEFLLNKKASFNAQMKQAEITYQQLTGALHVVEEMIKAEEDLLEQERLKKEEEQRLLNEKETNNDETNNEEQE